MIIWRGWCYYLIEKPLWKEVKRKEKTLFQWFFGECVEVHNPHDNPIWERFCHSRKNPLPLCSLSRALCSSQAPLHLRSGAMDWPVLDIARKRIPTALGLLCLASLTPHLVFEGSTLWRVSALRSFLWPSHIPLQGWTTDCPSVYQMVDIWIAFAFWLWWIKLLWTFVCKCLDVGFHFCWV